MSATDWIKAILFLVALVGWIVWTGRRSWLSSKSEHDQAAPPPSDRQLRWDITHMREDLSVLIMVNSILLWFVAFTIVFGWR